MTIDLHSIRSLLFLPASNPRAISKARTAGADLVVLDLEDAVKAKDKETARDAAIAAVAEPWPCAVAIRVNSSRSEWHLQDVGAIMHSQVPVIVLPRTEGREELALLQEQIGRPVLAMIETAKGVLAAHSVAREAAALIAGTNDLAADLGLRPGGDRAALVTALQTLILAARAAGVAAFDGVHNRLDDPEGFAAQCEEGRRFGFDGKSLIHPNQIEPANRLFGPSESEIEAAKLLLAAATGGAERFEGVMIERMHVEQARWVLARARA